MKPYIVTKAVAFYLRHGIVTISESLKVTRGGEILKRSKPN